MRRGRAFGQNSSTLVVYDYTRKVGLNGSMYDFGRSTLTHKAFKKAKEAANSRTHGREA